MNANEIPTPPSDAPKRLKVLVVDDERDLAGGVCAFLQALGFTAFACHDGASALEMCKQHDPDVVVMDLTMPGMHGFDVGPALKKIRGNDRPKVILLTGIANDFALDQRAILLLSKADVFLKKPFKPTELLVAIGKLFLPLEQQPAA